MRSRFLPGKKLAFCAAVIAVTTLAGLTAWGGLTLALQNPSGRAALKRGYQSAQKMIPFLPALGGAARAETGADYPLEQADAPLEIYRDGLAKDWADWSWAAHNLKETATVKSGTAAISLPLSGYKGIFLTHPAVAIGGYGDLEFWYNGPAGAEKDWGIGVANAESKLGKPIPAEKYVAAAERGANGWRKIRIPLTDFGLNRERGVLGGICFQATISAPGPTIYLDDISLRVDERLPAAITAATIEAQVTPGADIHPISPLIYGLAFASPEEMRSYGATLNRWGGNPNTRYNWVGNCWNAARNWEFRNYGWEGNVKAGGPAGEVSDRFVAGCRSANAAAMMTIPTIGWVAKNGDKTVRSLGVPANGGIPLQSADGAIAGYDPTINRERVAVRSLPRKGRPFEMSPKASPDGKYTVYQDEFVAHLVKRFGNAHQGGVRFYAMDNEPDLWAATHTDVQPALPGYEDILNRFSEYATAVKAVDPAAQITGPVSWGWTGYIHSPQDTAAGRLFARPDRKAHGDEPFLPWFLKSMRKRDEAAGKRTLDVLDIHYYPQATGVYSQRADRATQKMRLRSTRSLWDANYRDESWIGDTVELIPRMKRWIAENYPGTKLGITEWNFGAESDISGGLATAEALGAFGREDVYLANYWTKPKANSPAAQAFRLFRNPEGKPQAGGGFGDKSCRARSSAPDRLSCFAAMDSKTGAVSVILINKMPKATLKVPLTIRGAGNASVQKYVFSAQRPNKIEKTTGPTLNGGRATLTLPPFSATLIVCKTGKTND